VASPCLFGAAFAEVNQLGSGGTTSPKGGQDFAVRRKIARLGGKQVRRAAAQRVASSGACSCHCHPSSDGEIFDRHALAVATPHAGALHRRGACLQ